LLRTLSEGFHTEVREPRSKKQRQCQDTLPEFKDILESVRIQTAELPEKEKEEEEEPEDSPSAKETDEEEEEEEDDPHVPPPEDSPSVKQKKLHDMERFQAAQAVQKNVEAAQIQRSSSQDKNAERMTDRYIRSLNPVPPGSIVSIKIDKRDRALASSTRGVLGIVVEESSNHVMGVRVATQWGVVTGHQNTLRFFAPDQYLVLDAERTTLNPELQQVRTSVRLGEYIESNYPRISIRTAHGHFIGRHNIAIAHCSCKVNSKGKSGRCGKNCGCRRKGIACDPSRCQCKGDCGNH
jgi:hypothetical protein